MGRFPPLLAGALWMKSTIERARQRWAGIRAKLAWLAVQWPCYSQLAQLSVSSAASRAAPCHARPLTGPVVLHGARQGKYMLASRFSSLLLPLLLLLFSSSHLKPSR